MGRMLTSLCCVEHGGVSRDTVLANETNQVCVSKQGRNDRKMPGWGLDRESWGSADCL